MNIRKIIKEEIDKIISESDRHKEGYFKNKPDRHREGYWKERWAKQKAAKDTEKQNDTSSPKNKPSKPQKDRHRKGYYHDYNQAHPERLNRGFTKGYDSGKVSYGVKQKKRQRLNNKTLGIYTIGDMLRNKEMEWHDDDWDEGSWDD